MLYFCSFLATIPFLHVAPLFLVTATLQLALHNGVVLDWGSAGAADAAAAALTRKNKKMPTDGIGGGGGGGFTSGSRYSTNPGGENGHATTGVESIEHGVSGEEAMAQALIAGREERTHLEDRLQLSERRVGKLRGETLRLRAILERWHAEFVAPALQEAQVRDRWRV